MNHSGETKKHRLGRKQFILLIVFVCLVALLAEAVLLIHTFLKKKKPAAKEMQPEEPKTYVKQTVRRVSKATRLINEYVCSLCRHKTDKQTKNCPGCGRIMYGVRSDTNWVDEMEGIDAILDD